MKKIEMPPELSQLYFQLKKEKKNRYGKFHKGLFHIHTPASFDYRLLESVPSGKHYKDCLSEQELFDACRSLNSRFELVFSTLECVEVIQGFADRKEMLGYLCIAYALENAKIEYVIVTDHNTISGYDKLSLAIEYINFGSKRKRPCVIAGVEVSCADRNHVVVVFDQKKPKVKEHIQRWLDENIMTTEIGSFRTSFDVLSEFNDEDVIAYIAHINSSSTFERGFFSGGYKEKLFQIRDTCLVGLSDIGKQAQTLQRIEEYAGNRSIVTLLDNDSHTLDTLSTSVTYIKGSKLDFDAIQDAISDYDTCIAFEIKSLPVCYIDGLIVQPGQKGFLCESKEQPENPLVLSFSPSMNCLIGGRGTGKSTIINCLNVLLGGQYESDEILEGVCRHQGIAVIAYIDGKEYWVDYCGPEESDMDVTATETIRRKARSNPKYRTQRGYFDPIQDLMMYLQSECISIYEVNSTDQIPTWIKVPAKTKKHVLNKLFRRAYSINEMMVKVSNNHVSEFVEGVICQNDELRRACRERSIPEKEDVPSMILLAKKVADEREKKVREIIEGYNENSGNVRISICNASEAKRYIEIIFPYLEPREERRLQNYNISRKAFADYLAALIDKVGIIETISMLSTKDYEKMINAVALELYSEVYTKHDTENEITRIVGSNQKEALSDICAVMKWDQYSMRLMDCVSMYANQRFMFDLEFDLSSSDDNVTAKPDFRSIRYLSLGQKVVAILTFILSFGKFTGDSTPLVIDQPEDNLDSQYIYSNLVEILRRIKDERQVIIATHNSTLVTNTKTEQVIVMKSDNKHGWVECTGYPTQTRIVKKILQYLEGGKPSFVHREHVYHRELK